MKVLQILVLLFGLIVSINAQKAALSGAITDELSTFISDVKIGAKGKDGKIISTRATLFSDSIPGTINLSGTVYDQQGAVVLGTKISFKNKQGIEYLAKQNMEGKFSIDLPVGIYQIESAANGFEKYKVKNYRIVAADSRKMFFDVVLEVSEPDNIIKIKTTS